MSYRYHGLMSILAFFSAAILALVCAAKVSQILFWGYLLSVVMGVMGIILAFCVKCPCRKTKCSHFIIGPLAGIFPQRPVGPYRAWEIALLIASFLAVIVPPQFWIWRFSRAGIIFWVLFAFTVADILIIVCKECRNIHCPMNRFKK